MGLLSGLLFYKDEGADNIRGLLANMLAAQKHRDKTEPITFFDKGCAVGMANRQNYIFDSGRNIPIDVNTGICDGIYAFVDGIVLNLPMHRKYFEDSGIHIPILSSTVIVSMAYKMWGMEFMSHLEGEFACCVWDSKEEKIILARDPYGHKPLHYYYDSNKFVFSSEIKGVLAGSVQPRIDMLSLSNFLTLNCVPCSGTIFENIKQVSPGSMLVVSGQGINECKYWQCKLDVVQSISLDDTVLQLTDKIRNSVRKRIISENNYCFLSGGIDSSAVLSFAAELSISPVNAITVGFDDQEADELEYAKLMAQHVGAKHNYVIAKPDSFFSMIDMLVFHHDSPFTDTSAFPTYYAAKLARQYTDIILTGDGPDQTMGGSGHHALALKNNIFKKRNHALRCLFGLSAGILSPFMKSFLPSSCSKIIRKLYRNSLTPVHAEYDLRSFFPDLIKKRICCGELWRKHRLNNPYKHPEGWFNEVSGADYINKYLFADVKFYVVDDLMIKVDRMCMAHGLETLSPFQDLRLAEAVNKLPSKYKVNRSDKGDITTKYILKKVCENRFPKEILTKKKQGFGIPLAKWLRQQNGKFLKEILLDKKTLSRGYFNADAYENFVQDFVENKGDYYYPSANGIVGLLTLELWHRRYID